MVTLQAKPFMSTKTLLFQRFSVILCDIVFVGIRPIGLMKVL
jgi:hypothetical protein